MPWSTCSGNPPLPAITATDSAVSRSTRRAPIRHPPSTFGRVSTSSHTLTTKSSQRLDLWRTPPLTSPRRRCTRWRSSQQSQHFVHCDPRADGPSEAGQMPTPWSSSPAVYSVPPLLEGAKTVSFSEQALVSLLGCPDAASWSGERRIRFELGVLSVADTWNPSDDERNAARDFCAPQGPLTDMRIPDEYEAANPDTAIKVWNSESSLMNRGPSASCRPRLAADGVRRT